MPVDESTRVQLEKSVSFILEPGIIVNDFKDRAFLEASDLEACRDANLQLANGRRYTVLMSFGYLANTSKEARAAAARNKFSPLNQGIAMMASSTGEQLMGNFYLRMNKPAVRTKLFKRREEAILWLREILEQENVVSKDWV